MKEPFELNKALFEAVAACNYEEAERLLNLGADPLGSTDETDADKHLLGSSFAKCRITRLWRLRFRSFWNFFMRTEWILPPAASLRMTETTSTRFGCWPFAKRNPD